VASLIEQLQKDIATAGLSIPESTQIKLIDFILLLEKWNKTHNLTSIRDPQTMITKHLMDCLVVVPYITTQRNLDVGTGAGLPGIPLALASPDQHWTLLDSTAKKMAFVTHVCGVLGIKNVAVVTSRAEAYQPDNCFDCIITRALSTIPDIISKTKHLLCKDGTLMAMKGQNPQEELKNLSGFVTVQALNVPRLTESRHLVCIKGISGG
jgi:16S rRNA (guanine527-N7)-methyltransferase